MATAIRMPLMSDTMTEGKIIQWNKKVGDKVKSDDSLAEVETDKATMDVVGYEEGTLLYIGVEAGKSAKINDIIAIVGKKGENFQSILDEDKNKDAKGDQKSSNDEKKEAVSDKKESAQPEKKSENVELPKDAKVIRMPLMSDTMTEGKIIQWNKKVGDKVKSDDALAEVETDKATMEVVGYEEGTLLYIGVEAGKAAKVNDIIAIVGKEGTDVSAFVEAQKNAPQESEEKEEKPEEEAPEHQTKAPPAVQNNATPQPSSAEGGRVKASPLAKKLADDKGIDISQVQGTGDGGRIVKRDIDSFVPPTTSKPETKKASEAKPVQPFAQIGQESYEDIPNSQMRNTIARRLGESKFQAPHFYLTMEINMDNAITSRKGMNEISPKKF